MIFPLSRSDPFNSNPGYIPAKDWHNAAAKISEEMQDPSLAAEAWRRYQFLHLFHFGSHVLRSAWLYYSRIDDQTIRI